MQNAHHNSAKPRASQVHMAYHRSRFQLDVHHANMFIDALREYATNVLVNFSFIL